MDNQNTSGNPCGYRSGGVLILVLMDNQGGVLILVLMDNQNTPTPLVCMEESVLILVLMDNQNTNNTIEPDPEATES